jgi:phage terminase large subunit-like protein
LYYFDEEAANLPIEFIQEFDTHAKGELAGMPIDPLPWEKDYIRNFFGWKKKSDGKRRYKTLFIQVARKNNKSTGIGSIVKFLFFTTKRLGTEYYIAAADRDQADQLFTDILKPQIEQNEILKNGCEIFSRTIVRPKTRAKLKVLASDGARLHGKNADVVIIDELWALTTEKQKEVIPALITSVATKDEPIIIFITTPGYDRNTPAYEYYKYAKGILSGNIKDDTFYPLIFEADENDDPFDEATWYKANPGLGHTVKLDYLKEKANKAKQFPSELNIFKRLHLGMWTKAETVFIPAHIWDQGDKEKRDLEYYRGRNCFAAIDLANYNDLLPVAYIFPNGDGYTDPIDSSKNKEETADILIDYWVTEEKANSRKAKNEADYITWVDQKYVSLVPGNVLDYQLIRKRINEVSRIVNIKVIAYDEWNASQFAQDLATDGFNINPWSPQNFKLWHKPTQFLEKMATAGMLNHMGNPVLAWNIENVVIRYNGEYMKPDKSKSRDKIDGVITLIMGIGEWMGHQDDTFNFRGEWLD